MIQRVQIRASGQTAHDVETELRWAAARIRCELGLTGELTDQVIEGTPGKQFSGRLSLTVTSQDPAAAEVPAIEVTLS